MSRHMKILFATSEAWPLIKTGGLADVAYGLCDAVRRGGDDIRLLLPAYPEALAALSGRRKRHRLTLDGRPFTLIQGGLADSDLPVWLLDDPPLFARIGNPYATEDGDAWPDNARRFHRLSRVAAALAAGELLSWRADLLHANDWQTALAPFFLRQHRHPVATLFTVHNLAYRGLFPASTHRLLELPSESWHPDALEFFGQLAFIKGGLIAADAITTVSPTYAREIQTPAFGCGLDGLLSHRRTALHGILNGIDTATWNPATDPHLAARYDRPDPRARAANRALLCHRFGLTPRAEQPLLGFVGRLVAQKGVDLIVAALPELLAMGAQVVVLGSGERTFEQALIAAAAAHPEAVGVEIGYDEGLAHLIEGGSDLFLMPSRFEPCGLNQLYSQRYGTPPVVTATGGLLDTVTDVATAPDHATGFRLAEHSAAALVGAVETALESWRQPQRWQSIQQRGMAGDYGWDVSAATYRALYRALIAARDATP